MNLFACKDCGGPARLYCPACGSRNVRVQGALWLGSVLGINVRIAVRQSDGNVYLIIEKPSGQSRIELQATDLMP